MDDSDFHSLIGACMSHGDSIFVHRSECLAQGGHRFTVERPLREMVTSSNAFVNSSDALVTSGV